MSISLLPPLAQLGALQGGCSAAPDRLLLTSYAKLMFAAGRPLAWEVAHRRTADWPQGRRHTAT